MFDRRVMEDQQIAGRSRGKCVGFAVSICKLNEEVLIGQLLDDRPGLAGDQGDTLDREHGLGQCDGVEEFYFVSHRLIVAL